MRSCPDAINPPSLPADLDLEVYTEATRRVLYDLVVAVHFTAPAAVKRGDWYPDYSPDEAGLVVAFRPWALAGPLDPARGGELRPARVAPPGARSHPGRPGGALRGDVP